MKNAHTIATLAAACTLSVASLLVPHTAAGQVSEEQRAAVAEAQRARDITRAFQANARQLTLFDREGALVGTIGERDLYNQPVLSPDRTRVAVIRIDLQAETNDLWVLDLATGEGTQITDSRPREQVAAPAWSPDGSQVAYVALRDSYFGLYRKSSNGSGEEELLYRHAGGPIVLTDWSLDGRYLSFYSADLSGASLYLLPLEGEREVIEAARSEHNLVAARLSPDSRFLAYRSDETGTDEIFVRPVAPAGADVDKWQLSTDGGLGMVSWRRDGRELYYLGSERRVMAVDVDTRRGFEFGRPSVLFRAPEGIPVTGAPGALGNVSKDGQRVVFAVPPGPQPTRITVLDRGGNVVSRLGEPGLYNQPTFSPDGSRVAALRQDVRTGNVDVWTFDLGTGEDAAVTTTDDSQERAPIWFPDGAHVAYVSNRDDRDGIYRRAWNGEGPEELLYRYTPGAFLTLTDVSADGRFLTFDGGGFVLVVPLTGTDPLAREAVDYSRSEFEAGAARFSPDGRFMAYASNESGRFEVYVRPFDAATGAAPTGEKRRISRDGAAGGIVWREDGEELFYLSEDTETPEVTDAKVMAVAVTTTPEFQAQAPRVLFRISLPLQGNPAQWKNVSADGRRFVFALPVAEEDG